MIDLQEKTLAIFVMQTRSADMRAQNVQDDVFTVTAVCIDEPTCGTQSYSALAVHSTDGIYTATFDPRVVGPYGVTITMTNEFLNVLYTDTTVDMGMLTVIDNRSVPSESTVVSQPATNTA